MNEMYFTYTKKKRLEELRKRAETNLNKNLRKSNRYSHREVAELTHELDVYSTELEMQNEELQKTEETLNKTVEKLRETVEELNESVGKYRSLYDYSPVAYLTINIEGKISEANKMFVSMIGKVDHEVVCGKSFYDYISDEDKDILFIHIRKTFGDKAKQVCELTLKDLNNNKVLVYIESVLPHKDSKECRLAILDVTQKKKLEKENELIKEQMFEETRLSSLGRLAGGMGHEINNPLTIIKGNIELIEDESDSNKFRKSLNIINESIERIKNIVYGLRNYARTDLAFDETMNVHNVTINTIALMESIYNKENVFFNNELSSSLCTVKGNAGKFQQVLLNLFSNAKDAMGEKGGLIKIETERIDKSIIVKIIDNGSGITPENVKKIFDPFFTTKEIGKGTGLGLGIVHTIIEGMKGKIEVGSKPGKGTTFTITLPITAKKETVLPKRQIEIFKQIHGKALVVDDEEEIRNLLCDQLVDIGLTVEEADDGDTALEKLKTNKYDFLLLDLKMPRIRAEILLSEMKKHQITGVKTLIITGCVETEENSQKFKELKKQTDGFIVKPFRKNEVYKILTSLNNKSS